MKLLDITGERFGKLVAVERSAENRGNRVSWDCKCDCGNTISVKSTSLKSGNTKSCGCISAESRLSGWMRRRKTSMRDQGLKKYYAKYAHSAKTRNIDFCLSIEEFDKIISLQCTYCGADPKEMTSLYGSKMMGVLAPGAALVLRGNGIDRVNSNIGYILDNCVPCCTKCNYMKASTAVDEFRSHVARIYNHIGDFDFSLIDMCSQKASVDEFYRKAA